MNPFVHSYANIRPIGTPRGSRLTGWRPPINRSAAQVHIMRDATDLGARELKWLVVENWYTSDVQRNWDYELFDAQLARDGLL